MSVRVNGKDYYC